jgi:hypothetical protein
MSRVLLSRRAFLQATAALGAAVGLDEEAAAKRRRRFWFLDRRHTGLHDFYHFVGYVDDPIQPPPSPEQDVAGVVSIAPPKDGGGALYMNMAWEVKQVLSSGKHFYRAPHQLTDRRCKVIVGRPHARRRCRRRMDESSRSRANTRDRHSTTLRGAWISQGEPQGVGALRQSVLFRWHVRTEHAQASARDWRTYTVLRVASPASTTCPKGSEPPGHWQTARLGIRTDGTSCGLVSRAAAGETRLATHTLQELATVARQHVCRH